MRLLRKMKGAAMTRLDFWYNNNPADVDRISISFNDLDCTYRGNLYANGRTIGDYVSNDSVALAKHLPQLCFNWGR